MKNLPNLTLLIVFTIITLQVNADNIDDLLKNSNRGPQPISQQQVDQLRQNIRQQHLANNGGSRASDMTLMLDYFACEEQQAINDGYDWQQFIWDVNRNWPTINYPSFKWIMTDFYTHTGYDADIPNAVCSDYSINYYSLDSIYIPIVYENTTASVDTLIITVYADDWGLTGQGPTDGITPSTTVLWTDTFLSGTDFFTGSPIQLQNFYVYPGLSFNAQEYFAVRLDFVGDTTNTFMAFAGYRDECNNTEGASENVHVPLNSIYFINADLVGSGGPNLTGINNIGFTYGTCPDFFTKNWFMIPFLSANANFNLSISATGVSGCSGNVIDLTANASGASGPVAYSWSTSSGQLTLTTGANTSLILGANDAWAKVTVTDGVETLIDSILITSNDINVSLPNTITLNCGSDSLIIPQVSGNLNQVQYAWVGPNGTSSSPIYTVENPGALSVTVTNSSGCSDSDNSTVNVASINQVLNFTVRNVTTNIQDSTCYQVNQNIQLTNTSSELSNWDFEWYYTEGTTTLVQPIVQFSITGLGVVITLEATQISNPNCIVTLTKTIDVLPSGSCSNIVPNLVWPGDADNNGVVDNNDVLAIGIGFGNTGPVRQNASLNWVGQFATDWNLQITNGANLKYVDCNGDGLIDNTDTLAISQNYSLVHNKGGGNNGQRFVDPTLYLVLPSDTISAGMTITADVELGDQTLPTNSVYGMAFTINYDGDLIKENSVKFKANGSWLGDLGQTLIDFNQNISGQSRIDITITRTDQNNISGFGKLGELVFTIKDSISANNNIINSVEFEFSSVNLIDADMNVTSVYHESTSTYVTQWPVSIGIIDESKIAIYPNPTKNQLTIETGGNVSNWQIVDLFGREIKSSINPKLVETLDVSNFESGIYFIRLQSEGSIVAKRFTVVK